MAMQGDKEEVSRKQVNSASNLAIWSQAWASCSAFAAAMAIGASAGFSGVTIPQLQDKNELFQLTDEQISWFASLPTFATIPTCIFGGLMGQAYGRRLSLVLVAPLFATSFICQAAAPDVGLFQFGRLLSGIAAGLVSSPASTYVSEISDPNWRATLGACIGLSYLLGTLSIYTLGAICHWRHLAWISTIFPCLSFITGLFSPESPSWLVTKGRLIEAKKSLIWLQRPLGCCHSSTLTMEAAADSIDPLKAEIEKLKKSYEEKSANETDGDAGDRNGGCAATIKRYGSLICRRRDVWRPMIIMFVLFLLQQFCGLSTISFYAVNVLSASHSSVDEYLGTIIFGIARVAAQLFGSYLLLRIKRRILFVTSATVTGLGMALLALSTSDLLVSSSNSAQENSSLGATTSSFVGALPLISVMLAALGYQFGLSPIAWAYAGELFPMDLRAELTGLANCFGNLSIFLVVKTFPNLSSVLGLSGAYWLYSGVCLLNVIFGLLFLPETKGKHLEDITKEFHQQSSSKKEKKSHDALDSLVVDEETDYR